MTNVSTFAPKKLTNQLIPGGPWWDWAFAWDIMPDMLMAFLQYTLVVTIIGTVIAAGAGADHRHSDHGAAETSRVDRDRWVSNFIRMTPIVVQLILLFWSFLWLDAMTIGIIVYGVHYATYMSKVYRAGVHRCPRGSGRPLRHCR